jgi:hypothetical protein
MNQLRNACPIANPIARLCVNQLAHLNDQKRRVFSCLKDTASREANECIFNVMDSPEILSVFDADDIETNVFGIDIMVPEEMMCGSGNTALFGGVNGFNRLGNEAAFAHFDFNEYPRVLASTDQIDFRPTPAPISRQYTRISIL